MLTDSQREDLRKRFGLLKYDEHQPRDGDGQWTTGGGRYRAPADSERARKPWSEQTHEERRASDHFFRAWDDITRGTEYQEDPQTAFPERYVNRQEANPKAMYGMVLRRGQVETRYRANDQGSIELFDVTPHEGPVDTIPKASFRQMGGGEGSSWLVEKPGSTRPLIHTFRIVDEAEYEEAKSRGYFKSNESMNLGGEEGTVMSLRSTGSFYAPKGRTSRIVRFKYDPAWKLDPADEYVKTQAKIPWSAVDRVSGVIEPHPVEKFELTGEVNKDGTKRGGGGQQQSYDAMGRYGHNTIGRVGVRQPKTGDPAALRMDLDDILKTDPKWGERSLELMRQVPGLQKAKSHEEIVEKLTANIRDTLATVSPELETLARSWYPLGHEFNIKEANANGLPGDVMHVVTARLSPQKDWYHNLAMARAFARSYSEDPKLDYDTIDTANLIRVSAWETKKNPNIPKPEIIDSSKYVGKRLSELPDELAGEIVRSLTVLRDENFTINIDGTPVVTNAGKPQTISWQSNDSMGRAMRMIRAQDAATAHEVLGAQHKIRSFYENLRDPHNTSGFDDATIDTHALGMAVGIPWSSSERMINTFFGSPKSTKAGVTGVYPLFVEANRRIRYEQPERFTNTNQVQAVTWEGQRALWPRTAKKKWVMDAIARVRVREGNGDISHNEAQQIVEALRVQLPGVATGGAGAGTPAGVKGLPAWVLKDVLKSKSWDAEIEYPPLDEEGTHHMLTSEEMAELAKKLGLVKGEIERLGTRYPGETDTFAPEAEQTEDNESPQGDAEGEEHNRRTLRELSPTHLSPEGKAWLASAMPAERRARLRDLNLARYV